MRKFAGLVCALALSSLLVGCCSMGKCSLENQRTYDSSMSAYKDGR